MREESRWVSNWGPGWILNRKQAEHPPGLVQCKAKMSAQLEPSKLWPALPRSALPQGPPSLRYKENQLRPSSWDKW